ncbi:MAG TPA: phosphoglycerate mutase family protein [Gemmatimonadaceae bacterium]
MKRRVFLCALAGAVWMAATAATATNAVAQVPVATTVIVVRHAEKALEPAKDPPLTAAGQARARALAQALKDAGVSAIITTQFARTKETAAPTAEMLGIKPEIVRAGSGPEADHATAVATAVMQHAGGVVLVVGHSNTVPDIVAALGAKRPPEICDAEYDRMEIVTIAWGGKATVVTARYGAPTVERGKCEAMK